MITNATTRLPHSRDSIADFNVLAALARASRSRPVWLRVGQLFDGIARAPYRGANILFDSDRIRFVGGGDDVPNQSQLAPGQSAPDADLPDLTMLPMFIEAHAHMFLEGAPIDSRSRQEYLTESAAWMLARARGRWNKILACGIGAVRDAGDKHGVGLALAAESKAQHGVRRTTPELDSPGAAIYHRGRYGSFMGEPLEDHATPAACVAARVAAGADRIKLLVSGIINFQVGQVTAPPQMSATEVSAIVDAARSCVRQTFAHASGTEGIENAIAGGVTTIEHGFFITRDQLARMRDLQIGWVPTMAPVALQLDRAAEFGHDQTVTSHLQRVLSAHREMLCHAHEIGVAIIAGSDAGSCGVPHGLGLLDELEHMEGAGLPPAVVLQSATAASARVLDFPDAIGRIAPGCRTRMILTRHNPLVTVANLRREKTVLFDGEAIQSEAGLDSAGL